MKRPPLLVRFLWFEDLASIALSSITPLIEDNAASILLSFSRASLSTGKKFYHPLPSGHFSSSNSANSNTVFSSTSMAKRRDPSCTYPMTAPTMPVFLLFFNLLKRSTILEAECQYSPPFSPVALYFGRLPR